MDTNKIHHCPNCGAEVYSAHTAFCPYCNAELIDLSREHTDQKIAEVKKAQRKVLSLPKKIALAISCTIFVMLILTIIFVSTDAFDKIKEKRAENEADKYTAAMKEAYENEDWDALYDIVITDSTNALNSSAYFMYRTAWFINVYPDEFDEAYQNGDTEHMQFIYDTIKADYDSYTNDKYQYYTTDPSIEESLKEEYLREKEIMDSLKGDTTK